MEMSLIQRIISYLLGYKYYANIVNTKGTGKYEICSFIFDNKADAERHMRDLKTRNLSFSYIETISFRSRLIYPNTKR